jgi:ribulose-phosphate 3-epimerase
MTEIIPAILTNDLSDFRKKYAELFSLSHFFTKVHIDFSDNDFVEMNTVDLKDLFFIKPTLGLVAHLMVANPKDYFEDAKKIGFSYVVFHFEAFEDPQAIYPTIELAKKLNLKTGLAINPETKLFEAGEFLDKVDMVQVMGVHPGLQGQKFEPGTLEKIRELRKLLNKSIICVDGGVKVGIVQECVKAGANWLAVGSAIWQADNQKLAVEALAADSETGLTAVI